MVFMVFKELLRLLETVIEEVRGNGQASEKTA